MEVEIRAKAMKNLAEIAEYIDAINTQGAGSRWLDRFFDRITAYAKPNIQYPICRNNKLASKGYSCIIYKKWVIAFKILRGKFVVYEVIFGPILT